MKIATRIAVIVFSLVALGHLLRLVIGVELIVAGWVVPMWISIPGILVPGALAYLIAKEHT